MTRLPILGRPMVNAAACAACGGACCKNYPGHAGPEDFPDLGRLEALLVAGRWTLDEWIGDPLWKVLSRRRRRHGTPAPRYVARVLLPRPAIRGHEGKPYHAPGACRTGCTFHSAAGCELTFAARPEQCRVLPPDPEPDVDRKVCSGPEWSSDKSMALRWRSRTAELEAMLERISRARAA